MHISGLQNDSGRTPARAIRAIVDKLVCDRSIFGKAGRNGGMDQTVFKLHARKIDGRKQSRIGIMWCHKNLLYKPLLASDLV
jgi:hypothetical protein